jgi:hypothetical protein
LDDAFLSAAPDEEALFALTVTKNWLRQVIVGLALICHSYYRGVVEFLRDLLGISISVGITPAVPVPSSLRSIFALVLWSMRLRGRVLTHDMPVPAVGVVGAPGSPRTGCPSLVG